MKAYQLSSIFAFHVLVIANVAAEVRYVDVNGTKPTPPFTSWLTAATTIQDAVDAAVAGDQILVTNGVYEIGGKADASGITNRVTVDKALSLQSVNGPRFTVIKGSGVWRCVSLTQGASLSGFLLTNGVTTASGGGVWCASKSETVSNCVLTGNSALSGGGVFRGTLERCTIAGNTAQNGGGARDATLVACRVNSNSAVRGGGVYGVALGPANLTNCTLIGNSALYGGGAYGEAAGVSCTLVHCTLVGNVATGELNGATGEYGGGGAEGSRLINSIAYYNTGPAPHNSNVHRCSVDYSCTTPGPQSGNGYITNAPWFIDLPNGNLHLRHHSAGIDAAIDMGAVSADLDGRARSLDGNADGVARSDMGAYEHAVLFVRGDNPNSSPPYNSWLSAAANLQDAADFAMAGVGDQILVTNGVYRYGGRVECRLVLDKASTTIESVTGPSFTVIDGGGAVRCVLMTNGTFLGGFTLTNGYAFFSGGGVGFLSAPYVESDAVVSNCVIVGNSGGSGGGAGSVLMTGSPIPMGGSLINCVLSNNVATTLQPGNPTVGIGGAAESCKLSGCALIGNFAAYGGSGASASRLVNCQVTGNSANAEGAATRWSWLYNCVVSSNSAGDGATFFSTLVNCTLTANPAGGAFYGFLTNCIVYDNGGAGNQIGATLNYCCTTPLPGSGAGNFTNAPLFVNQAAGNLRLQSNSPCINAGDNAASPGSTDLDGRPRVVGGVVDIGAYEFQPGVSGEFIGWLQKIGLPTDGSSDYADSDGDLHNNWQEWMAGTIPTNAASALRMLPPSSGISGVTVAWQSVGDRTYFLERSTNLGVSPSFSLVSSNLAGLPGTTSFTDTNAFVPGGFFYRVGVQ